MSKNFAHKRSTASSQLYSLLRDAIINLELQPGTAIVRAEIAEQYGVSQTPVREALLKLEEEGLVLTYPQAKTEIAKINLARAQETQFLRLSLELEVCRRLAQQKAAVPDAAAAIAAQETALAAHDLAAFTQYDKAFHAALFAAAGTSDLWQMVNARSGHIDRLRKLNLPDPGKTASILHYHHAILEAIAAGDMIGTETAVRGHLSGTLTQAENIKHQHPQYF